jgi:putative flippase GtrA
MLFTPLSESLNALKKLWDNRIVRFLVCGVISAIFNILLLALLIEFFRLDQPVWRNLANIISIEISVLFSFIVYRLWVWSSHSWSVHKIFKQEIPLYHLSCGASIVARSFILFPLLDWIGINYTINSLIGIAIGSAVNYSISNKWVFKSTK